MHLDLDLPSCSKFPISDQSSAIVLQSAFTVLVTKASLVPLLPAWEGMHRGSESTSHIDHTLCDSYMGGRN